MNSASKPRVVSLLSSATEILDALGGLPLLVGRSHECDFPAAVLELPCCSEPLIDTSASSGSIDEQVKRSASQAISIYRVFEDVLEELRPTHVLTQVQCDVCAVSLADVEQALARQCSGAVKVIALNPNSLDGIWEDFRRVGDALELPAEPVIANLQAEMQKISRSPTGLRVACIEWIDPLMAAGNWTPELIRMAGGNSVLGAAGLHSPWITWEELLNSKPDVTLIAPCGFDLQRTLAEIELAGLRFTTERLGRVYAADGNAWFNRPGPRVLETLRILIEVMFAESRAFDGIAWKRIQ